MSGSFPLSSVSFSLNDSNVRTSCRNLRFVAISCSRELSNATIRCRDFRFATTRIRELESHTSHDTTFKPITEATSVHVKKICIADVGSCSTNMPSSTVPTAPIPVHTGYAMLSGRVLEALISRYMLAIVNNMNPAIQSQCSVPVVTLAFPRQKVKEHSQRPAIIRITQFILLSFSRAAAPCRRLLRFQPQIYKILLKKPLRVKIAGESRSVYRQNSQNELFLDTLHKNRPIQAHSFERVQIECTECGFSSHTRSKDAETPGNPGACAHRLRRMRFFFTHSV